MSISISWKCQLWANFPGVDFLGTEISAETLKGAGGAGRGEFDVCLFAYELKNSGNIILARGLGEKVHE